MEQFRLIRTGAAFRLMAMGLSLYLVSCNGAGPNPVTVGDYRLNGVMVVDYNSDSTFVAADFQFKSSSLSTATVALASRSLTYNDTTFPVASVHSFQKDSALAFVPGGYLLALADSTLFSKNVAVTVTDSFSITNIVPATRLVQGNAQVSLEWNTAANVDGFIITAVHENSVGTGAGYSAYASAGASAGTIPPDAFLSANGTTPQIGLYYLYVYGFTGAPDSVLAQSLLPVPLPDQPDDNVTQPDFRARFGTVIVSLFDTVRVVQQP